MHTLNLLGLRYCSYQCRALSFIPNFLSRILSSRLWSTLLKAAKRSRIMTAVMFLFSISHSVSFVSLSRLVSQLKFLSVSRLVFLEQIICVTMVTELLKGAFFSHFGYEWKITYWSVVVIVCTFR